MSIHETKSVCASESLTSPHIIKGEKYLWDEISEENDNYTSDDFQLVFKGHTLDDDNYLYEVGIRNGSEIQLIKRMRPESIRCGSSSGRRNSMDRLVDFDVCNIQ
ncbi:hypothetical protein WMY93_013787 [Mugilogobius chulae]|uniref:Ubiquitin-like domain-containing protein n=1 Tax=Mugilogobius chulae TaxID=88201 RepID=A0AAW0PDD1_9GOBI